MAQQEFPPGQNTEGKVVDARSVLSKWYEDNAIYVDTIERKGEKQGKKNGIGRLIASKDRVERESKPRYLDGATVLPDNSFVGHLEVKPEHAVGHFNKDSELPTVFPGHKQIRAAVEVVGQAERLRRWNPNVGAVLWGFDSVEFKKIIKPGNLLDIKIREIERRNGIVWQDVEIKRGSEVVAAINNMVVELTDGRGDDNVVFLEDQMIESAAQTAGLVSDSVGDGETMPLFQSIGQTKFYSRVKTGDSVSMETETVSDAKRGFNSHVSMWSNGRRVGQISNLRATVVPLNVARRLLRG